MPERERIGIASAIIEISEDNDYGCTHRPDGDGLCGNDGRAVGRIDRDYAGHAGCEEHIGQVIEEVVNLG